MYKVVCHHAGCEWTLGYADSIGEAIELEAKCEDYGLFIHWVMRWDETSGRWVRAN